MAEPELTNDPSNRYGSPYMFHIGERTERASRPFLVRCLNDSDALTVALRLATEADGVDVWLNGRMILAVPPKKPVGP